MITRNHTIKRSQKRALPIAAIDCETDPFEAYRAIEPFAWGFYDGIMYQQFWGANSTDRFLSWLQNLRQPYQLYAHNGGRFDFNFMLRHLRGKPLIINGRIVDAQLGQHRVSDSYARMPVALARFGEKIEIDYDKLKIGSREKHKDEILAYLKQDCVLLYETIVAWHDRFGKKSSTMASAAFRECKNVLPATANKMSEHEDDKFRRFYYGGRVQAFAIGCVQDNLTMSDANSMYPHAMCAYSHPIGIGASWRMSRDIDEHTDFAVVQAWSKGALPLRTKDGLHFPSTLSTFYASGHEIRAGLKWGRLKIHRVIEARTCRERIDFSSFIKPVYAERMRMKASGNKMMTEFLKLLMNSCYGKLAINPRKFKDWIFLGQQDLDDYEVILTPEGRQVCVDGRWYCQANAPNDENGMIRFYRRPDQTRGFKNVACAASITAAARATLFEALCQADGPLYCDTDSIVARNVTTADDPYTLGAWKIEAFADEMAIAGKKMYALFGEVANEREAKIRIKKYGDPRCIKLASKGVKLSAANIRDMAMGNVIKYVSDVPTFDQNGRQSFLKRDVRITHADMVTPFPDVLTGRDVRGGLERMENVA